MLKKVSWSPVLDVVICWTGPPAGSNGVSSCSSSWRCSVRWWPCSRRATWCWWTTCRTTTGSSSRTSWGRCSPPTPAQRRSSHPVRTHSATFLPTRRTHVSYGSPAYFMANLLASPVSFVTISYRSPVWLVANTLVSFVINFSIAAQHSPLFDINVTCFQTQ